MKTLFPSRYLFSLVIACFTGAFISEVCLGAPYEPPVNYGSGSHTRRLVLADFNRDGRQDLAAVNNAANTATVRLTNPDGTLGNPVQLVTGNGPVALAVGDWIIRRPGLVVVNFADDTVSAYGGNADGTFGAAVVRAVGHQPVSAAAGRFRGTTRQDIVVANSGSDTISVLLNTNPNQNFPPAFAAAVHYAVGSQPVYVIVSDFNLDGKNDIAVANAGSSTVSILLGNGDGTFAAAVSYAVSSGPSALLARDFNDDGKLDIAVACAGAQSLNVLVGNGDGTFASGASFAIGGIPGHISAVDYNHDGNVDLAFPVTSANSVNVFYGNGDGTFSSAGSVAVGTSPSALVSYDFNHDNEIDFATSSDTASGGIDITLHSAPPVLAPFSIAGGFAGLNRSDTAANPPDTMGAVGPNHFVSILNIGMGVFDRSGHRLVQASGEAFFEVTVSGTTYPRSPRKMTDPMIRYDQRSGRWFATAMENGQSGVEGNGGHVILAVSNDSDPVGNPNNPNWISLKWRKYLIPVGTPDTRTDFPKLGLDDNGVYITTRTVLGSDPHKIVAIRKCPLLAGTLTSSDIFYLGPINDFRIVTQPAQNLSAVSPTDPAWFVGITLAAPAQIGYRRLFWNAGVPTLDNAPTFITVTDNIADPPGPPYKGGGPLSSWTYVPEAPVIRNNALWVLRPIGVNASGRSDGVGGAVDRDGLDWSRLDISGGVASLGDHGRVYDDAATNPRFFYAPSLTVNGRGDVVFGFTSSSVNEYPSSFFASRLATDPPGTARPAQLMKLGEATFGSGTAPYVDGADTYDPGIDEEEEEEEEQEEGIEDAGGPQFRWGDYSLVSVDPLDDMSFWSIQEYTLPRIPTQDFQWGTWIGVLNCPAPTLNSGSFEGPPGHHVSLTLNGSGFYDPGAGFPNRLTVTLTGGSPNGINNYTVTYVNSTTVQVQFDIAANAQIGPRNIVLTNPDGQSTTLNNGFSVVTRVYVSAFAPGPIHDGSSWERAFLTIQQGINAAPNGYTVLVAAGAMYSERINFLGKAIVVQSTAPQNPTATVIYGGGEGSVVTFASGEAWLSVLDGFTIIGGYTAGPIYGGYSPTWPPSSSSYVHGGGGGISIANSSPIIRRCNIQYNVSVYQAGGICIYNGSPGIENCTIRNNSTVPGSDGWGGGIGHYGGAPGIANCIIAQNFADSAGGVCTIGPLESASISLSHCTIADNFSSNEGQGAGLSLLAQGISIGSCIVWGNTANGTPSQISGSNVGVQHSDVQGGWAGAGWNNIDADPLFQGEYRLSPSSPCIDAGSSCCVGTDIDGQSRYLDGNANGVAEPDIGADEYLLLPPSQASLGGYYDSQTNVARLTFSAPNATSYKVLRKGPGEANFSVLADNVQATFYDDFATSFGISEYRVIAHNVLGDAPASQTLALENTINPALAISHIGNPQTSGQDVSFYWTVPTIAFDYVEFRRTSNWTDWTGVAGSLSISGDTLTLTNELTSDEAYYGNPYTYQARLVSGSYVGPWASCTD